MKNKEEQTAPKLRFKGYTDAWQQQKGTDLFISRSEKGFPELTILSATQDEGMIPRNKTGIDIKSSKTNLKGYKRIKPGDYIIHLRSFQGGFAYSALEGIGSPAYTVFTFKNRENFSDTFWKEKFTSYNFIQLLKKVTYGVRDGKSINYSDFLHLKQTFPSKSEQDKIGNLLSKLDKTISLLQRKLDKHEALKKALLQNLFPEKKQTVPSLRFKGFNENWQQRRLGELMEIGSVKRIHQSDWKNSGIRFFRARDIIAISKNEDVKDKIYISSETYNKFSSISGKVKVGDLLVTGVGSIGVPMLIVSEVPIYFKDGNIIWFKNRNILDGKFFYYEFNTRTIQSFINKSSGSGTVGTYTIDNGKKTPIIFPSKSEQEQIGNILSKLDETILLLQKQINTLNSLKQFLLQNMFI